MLSLHEAAKKGHTGTVKALLEKGAEVNAQDKFENTPLHLAAEHGHADIVKVLLENRADIDTKNGCGNTILHLAAKFSHIKVLNVLLARKDININIKGYNEATPLHMAAMYDRVEVVNLLLENGAEVNAQDKFKNTPLHLAARCNKVKVINALLSRKDIDIHIEGEGRCGRTPLHMAARYGKIEGIKVLLTRKDVKINARDQCDGNTPLHLAAGVGHIKVVQLLLSASADVNAKDNYGYTALHYAAEKGQIKVIKALLTRKDVNINIERCGTPLYKAAEYGQIGAVNLLLDKGADINARDRIKWRRNTSLHVAAKLGRKKIVMILLARGADSLLMNNAGKIPVDLAKNDEIRKIFEGTSELQEMKSKIIGKNGISLLDFLTADEASLTRYAHNSELLAALQKNKEQYKEDHPSFAEMIDTECEAIDVICEDIERRRRLENEALEPLGYLGVFEKGQKVKEFGEVVNEDLCRSIATYLTNASLTTLITVERDVNKVVG